MLFFKKKKKEQEQETTETEVVVSTAAIEPDNGEECADPEETVEVEVEPFSEGAESEDRLVEIREPAVLKMVEDLVSDAKKLSSIRDAIKGDTFKVVFPKKDAETGAKNELIKVARGKGKGDAYRGMYRTAGKDGIAGHVELKKPKVSLRAVATISNVASAVLEKYYLERIGNDFKAIKEGIAELSDFQDNEYRGKIGSLYNDVKTIVDHLDEITGNEELRKTTILKLADYEDKCAEMLEQASLTIVGIVGKTDRDYNGYMKAMRDVDKWSSFQLIQQQILRTVSDLRFTLSLGKISVALCYAKCNHYLDQIKETQGQLPEWHRVMTERLEINTEENLRKRSGWDRVLHYVPGLFKKEQNYCSIDEAVSQKIREQGAEQRLLSAPDEKNLFEMNVPLVFKNGKVFYLVVSEKSDPAESANREN